MNIFRASDDLRRASRAVWQCVPQNTLYPATPCTIEKALDHANPAADPFVYVVPGSWSADPRTPFPLPWAPTLPYHGFVDLFFSPNFDQTDSPEYHSYVIFMSLEGKQVLSAEQLQSDMLTWFRGLAVERGVPNKF